MQVTNMGRVLLFAGLSTLLLIGNAANGLAAAQGRAGMGANGGSAGASGTMHGSAMAPARVAGPVTSSPGSHLAIPRSPNGQIMARRASTMRGTVRYSANASARARQFRSQRGVGTDFSEDSNVPGLGFDAVHVAATRGNHGRDNRQDRRGRGNEFGVLFPFFDGGGGYYVPTGPDIAGDAQGDGQAVDDAEDQGPGPDAAGPDDRPGRVRSAGRLPLEQPGPQADIPEYVFVRRDGTVFFAVAYSWEQGALRYISSEGMRRSVPSDTLDLKATEQFNEQRGMTFRAPA
jgi:hypothetical protein